MCQSPRAAHHTVAAFSSGFPAKPVLCLLACSTSCAGRWTWQDPAYVLEVLVTGAQYWMWSATRATAEGSIVEVHWCFVQRVLPWLCFTCLLFLHVIVVFFFFLLLYSWVDASWSGHSFYMRWDYWSTSCPWELVDEWYCPVLHSMMWLSCSLWEHLLH